MGPVTLVVQWVVVWDRRSINGPNYKLSIRKCFQRTHKRKLTAIPNEVITSFDLESWPDAPAKLARLVNKPTILKKRKNRKSQQSAHSRMRIPDPSINNTNRHPFTKDSSSMQFVHSSSTMDIPQRSCSIIAERISLLHRFWLIYRLHGPNSCDAW